ncbi:hypothetical protein ACHAQA_000022 [Verticillium albo-atrum]
MTASAQLPPRSTSFFALFVESQFRQKPQLPPKDTTLASETAIITGSNTGLGLACAQILLGLGLSRIILAVRSSQKGEAVAHGLRTQYPDATIEVWPLDMSSYESIQAFTRRAATLPRIDYAILNAGLAQLFFRRSPAGHEEIFQINYLSTALLSILLLPVLKAAAPAGKPGRLTVVNSGMAMHATFKEHTANDLFAAFDNEKTFNAAERYSTSKLLFHLVIENLAAHVSADDVIVNLVDPGLVKGTDLHRNVTGLFSCLFSVMKATSGRTLEAGASTYVDAAVLKGKETHGSYIADWKVSPFANFCYTAESYAAKEHLWAETLREFEFANVKTILANLKAGL